MNWVTTVAAAIFISCWPTATWACTTLTAEGQREELQLERQFLRRESDKVVSGVFRSEANNRIEEDEYALYGVIEVNHRGALQRYRVRIPFVINCGFPYYYLEDGDRGQFYLKKTEYPDEDDLKDGYIDNFDYVHARIRESVE